MTPEELDDYEVLLPEVLAAVTYSYEAGQYPQMSDDVQVYVAGDGGLLETLHVAIRLTAALREANAALDKVRTLCSQNGYTTYDQEKHLGPPPWKHDDPAVQAWEKAHGHDVRLECYPEYGCLLLIDPYDVIAAIEGSGT